MNNLDEIRTLLNSALACLDSSDKVNGIRSAAWRVADAGLLIRSAIPNDDTTPGINEPTGRGAILPVLQLVDQSQG